MTAPAPNIALREYFSRFIFFIEIDSRRPIHRLLHQLAESGGSWSDWYFRKRRTDWERVWHRPSTSESVERWDDESEVLFDELQLPRDARIVLLSVRDAHYYRELIRTRGEVVGREAREETFDRNPDPDSYLQACGSLRRYGFHVVRIGVNQTPLSARWHGVAIDYANLNRTPRGDLVLARRAEFLLNGASGAWALTSLFNRPHLSLNCYEPFVASAYTYGSIFSHQLQREVGSGRLLSFQEMAQSSRIRRARTRGTEAAGVILEKHCSDEIDEMTLEMVGRQESTFHDTREDLDRRRRFDKIRQSATHVHEHGVVSAVFLRRHEDLL